MSEIILLSDNDKNIKTIQKYLPLHIITVFQQKDGVLEYIKNKTPEVIIVDTVGMKDAVNVCRAIKFDTQMQNIGIILIVDKKQKNKDFLKYASSYISKPIDKDILNATLNSVILTKHSLDELSESNSALSTSLYRLDELNKTITALAGSLDKSKIIEIMTSGIEKFLSYQLCYSLVFNDPLDITLSINSLHPISPRLEEAIKLRAIYSYKNLFNIHTTKEDIKVIKNIKRPNDFEYDLNILVPAKFDTVFAPINVKDKFFGIIEVFREKEFNKNVDVIAFQTLVKQATFPLQSAILYEEIKEQNDKLEEMEKKKSEFFSIVSHELRTPLTAIKNAITILLSGNIPNIPDRVVLFVKMIERNSEKIFSIVQEWLDSAKAETGKLDYNFTVANINPLVDSVKQSLSNLADEKNIDFTVNKTENIPALYIDTKRIEQVITNLVSNALKYTKNGGKITITTELTEAEMLKEKPFSKDKDRVLSDEYVVVKVSDTGDGIAKENLEKVFEKFEQVNGTLSRSVGGTGLGLFIAKQFADVHDGFLWVESVVHKGSDFYLAIPVLTEDERFEMQLRHDISNANSDKKSFGLITLCENKLTDKPYLVEFIRKLDCENIFKKSTDSKYFYTETKENLYYSFYDVNMNIQIFNFVIQRIKDFAQKDKNLQNGKKIYLSHVNYPDDAGDAEELMNQSKKQLKEVING
ncbi:MAG: hybrid sensor histidine kinase/response regulator [Candidatus Gastranaerophilales bacterium]|nr:hybrid sensor histidine kinase/response regulator [Candidatus Gastranaerophilales bacterium]